MLLGTREERENAAAFEQFLSKNFFNNEPISIIPKIPEYSGDSTPHVKIGSEELPIHELGDGIQSIILITLPFFSIRNERAIGFIEEPELNLHPGMQRILIKALHEEFPLHQFFFTTHSPTFLDLTMEYSDISVYRFSKIRHEKNNNNSIEITPTSYGDHDLLSTLGCRNSSLFLSNCTIWVEGISDRIYIKKILDIFLTHKGDAKIFKEDMHYSFVEYGGGNIVHWSFLDDLPEEDDDPATSPTEDEKIARIRVDRLCGHALLVADSDGLSEQLRTGYADNDNAKARRLRKLQKNMGSRFFRLECREIENILTPVVLDQAVKEYSSIPDDATIQEFGYEDYEQESMGDFLFQIYDKHRLPKKGRCIKASKSNSISDKLAFSKVATSHMNTISDLSEHAIDLAERIYEFISENNSTQY